MNHILYFLRPNRQMSVLQMMGIGLLALGLACIIGIGVSTLASPAPVTPAHPVSELPAAGSASKTVTVVTTIVPPSKEATMMAIGFLLITLAWPLIFPNMLRSSKGEISSIRAAVFMLVAACITLAMRTGWTDPSMEGLILGSGWVAILGIAFGAKTLQYFGENWPIRNGSGAMPLNVGAQGSPGTGATTGPGTGANPPPPGANVVTTRDAPIPTDFVQENAGDLPTQFHQGVATTTPQTAPPAVQRALANIKTKRK